jgi:hypothetical protein
MNKKAFLIYKDSLAVLDELTDEQAGQLFKAIKAYHEGSELALDFGLRMAFIPFKSQFIRDEDKYKAISEKNKENVLKRWKNTSVYDPIQTDTSNTDKDKDKDKDKDIKEKRKRDFITFWDLYNKKVDRTRAEAVFNKLKDSEVEIILQVVGRYVERTPEIKFRKDPKTWLNGKNWLDELETPATTKTKYIPTL